MRSTAFIFVFLLSLAPLYSLSLPTSHDNAAHRAGGVTNNCDPRLYKKKHVSSGINCAEMGGVGFQPANTNGLICMTIEQAKDAQSSGTCWKAKRSSGANRSAALPADESHNDFKFDMVKVHRDYRRASVVKTPIRPLPPIPTPADNANAQPNTPLRPLPKIPGQAPVSNGRPVTRPRPLPVIPGRRVQGPRPNPKIGRH